MSCLNMELSREEIERIYDYISEGIESWREFHEQAEKVYEFDIALRDKFENAMRDVSKFDADKN